MADFTMQKQARSKILVKTGLAGVKHNKATDYESEAGQYNEPVKETFRVKLKRLAAIVLSDADLQGVINAWPSMSDEAKTVCLKVAGVLDDG